MARGHHGPLVLVIDTCFFFTDDSLSSLNGQKFSTRDRDNDGIKKDCAAVNRNGGWWYGNGIEYCGPSGLNGKYFKKNENPRDTGILWTGWKKTSPWKIKGKERYYYSFKSTEMKIKRI